MELKEAIYHRRSVRDYTNQPVDRETVMDLVCAATQAPSAINQQPWEFVVIQDKALLKSYSDRAKMLYSATMDIGAMPAELETMLADPEFNVFYNAGTLIVICAKPIGKHPDWDCCLAAQNLMLAAHGMYLGTCPIGLAWPLFEQAGVKHELRIPADYASVLPIIVGYPHKPVPAVERNDPEIVCWR